MCEKDQEFVKYLHELNELSYKTLRVSFAAKRTQKETTKLKEIANTIDELIDNM
jgi:hypothetical protein